MWASPLLLLLPPCLAVLLLGLLAQRLLGSAGNPFAHPAPRSPRPLVTDQHARNRVLRRGESVCASVCPSAHPSRLMLCSCSACAVCERGACCSHACRAARGCELRAAPVHIAQLHIACCMGVYCTLRRSALHAALVHTAQLHVACCMRSSCMLHRHARHAAPMCTARLHIACCMRVYCTLHGCTLHILWVHTARCVAPYCTLCGCALCAG